MTETELIRYLTRNIPRRFRNLKTGIGDDCSVIRLGKKDILISLDSLIEGVHFKRSWGDWKMWGAKAAAVALSDIAAMGGTPQFAWVDLTLPKKFKPADAKKFYFGFNSLLKKYKVILAGGNVASNAKNFAASVTVMGEVPAGQAMLRSNAKPGDKVYLSGPLGGDFLRPKPHIKIGEKLRKMGCRCCIDVSDGLLKDLNHVALASKVKIRLFAEKISHQGPLKKALTRGEDYVLAFITGCQAPGEGFCKAIGVVSKGKVGVEVLDKKGKLLSFSKLGFDHTI